MISSQLWACRNANAIQTDTSSVSRPTPPCLSLDPYERTVGKRLALSLFALDLLLQGRHVTTQASNLTLGLRGWGVGVGVVHNTDMAVSGWAGGWGGWGARHQQGDHPKQHVTRQVACGLLQSHL